MMKKLFIVAMMFSMSLIVNAQSLKGFELGAIGGDVIKSETVAGVEGVLYIEVASNKKICLLGFASENLSISEVKNFVTAVKNNYSYSLVKVPKDDLPKSKDVAYVYQTGNIQCMVYATYNYLTENYDLTFVIMDAQLNEYENTRKQKK